MSLEEENNGEPITKENWDKAVGTFTSQSDGANHNLEKAIGEYQDIARNEIASRDARIQRLEADRRLLMSENVMTDYIKRLEAENKRLGAAFLRSNAAMRYYQEGNRGPWPQLGEKFKEPYQEKAREALKRIKEGGKDE